MRAVRACAVRKRRMLMRPFGALVYTILHIYFTKINSIFEDFMIN